MVAREQDPEQRARWRAAITGLPTTELIFLDETSTPLGLTPLRARSPAGTRAVGQVPKSRWTHVTLVATLTEQGWGPSLPFPGTLDRLTFETYVTTTLAPALHPGQIVILDNLSVHKGAAARQAIEAAGCQLLFLPTYSPDFNPIEQAFSKLKHLLRQVEARPEESIMDATARAYPAVTSRDAHGFFRNAGYNF